MEVVWRAVKGILPVRKLLHERGIDMDVVCPFCNVAEELIDHVVVSCPVVARWWFIILRGLRVQEDSTVQGLLQQDFQLGDPLLAAECVTFMWVIWEARNRLIFQGVQPQMEDLLRAASRWQFHRELLHSQRCSDSSQACGVDLDKTLSSSILMDHGLVIERLG